MIKTLRTLTLAPGVSGNEAAVRDAIIKEIAPHASYNIDPNGNLLVFKRGENRPARRVMLAAHMDEVGFIVTGIEESGLLKFTTVGGISSSVVLGSRVRVGDSGMNGVIATKPVHLLSKEEKEKNPDFDSLYIDIGAADQAEALRHVHPGDFAAWDTAFELMGGDIVKAKALDDRAGCAVLIRLIQNPSPYDLDIAFTVQEEVGLRGAKCAAQALSPEMAIVIDATTAADIVGIPAAKQVCKLGGGPAVSFMDGHTIYDREIVRTALDSAKRLGVRCQYKAAVTGGNDAGAIHINGNGVATLSLSLPCRYLHSPASLISTQDLNDTFAIVCDVAGKMADGSI